MPKPSGHSAADVRRQKEQQLARKPNRQPRHGDQRKQGQEGNPGTKPITANRRTLGIFYAVYVVIYDDGELVRHVFRVSCLGTGRLAVFLRCGSFEGRRRLVARSTSGMLKVGRRMSPDGFEFPRLLATSRMLRAALWRDDDDLTATAMRADKFLACQLGMGLEPMSVWTIEADQAIWPTDPSSATCFHDCPPKEVRSFQVHLYFSAPSPPISVANAAAQCKKKPSWRPKPRISPPRVGECPLQGRQARLTGRSVDDHIHADLAGVDHVHVDLLAGQGGEHADGHVVVAAHADAGDR